MLKRCKQTQTHNHRIIHIHTHTHLHLSYLFKRTFFYFSFQYHPSILNNFEDKDWFDWVLTFWFGSSVTSTYAYIKYIHMYTICISFSKIHFFLHLVSTSFPCTYIFFYFIFMLTIHSHSFDIVLFILYSIE